MGVRPDVSLPPGPASPCQLAPVQITPEMCRSVHPSPDIRHAVGLSHIAGSKVRLDDGSERRPQ
jgi:hypothetical protein